MDTGRYIAVSVIIPNYNHANYLRQRIESVLNQTFRDFEIIILDDCSTDESVQIIESYKDRPEISHVLINNQNSGSTFRQWERGIEHARGEWIWIAESDDWCEPLFLESLLKDPDPKVAIAFCQSKIINEEGKVIAETTWEKPIEKIQGKSFVLKHMLLGNQIQNASMCIFRKKYYESVSAEYRNYKFAGDWLLWIQIAMQGDVVIIAPQYNYFRKHAVNVSGRAYREGLGYYEFFKILGNFVNDNILDDYQRKKMLLHKFYQLLNDKEIEKVYKNDLYNKFRVKLGRIQSYFYKFKNFIVKKFKTPLTAWMGKIK